MPPDARIGGGRARRPGHNPRHPGPIAQRSEQATHNRLVTGSSPVGPTNTGFQGFLTPETPPQNIPFVMVYFGVPQGWEKTKKISRSLFAPPLESNGASQGGELLKPDLIKSYTCGCNCRTRAGGIRTRWKSADFARRTSNSGAQVVR